jgi:hypothetical protein
MRATEFLLEGRGGNRDDFVSMFTKFLPLAMKVLDLTSLPKFEFQSEIHPGEQPSFGMYVNDEHVLYVALANRHPVDILRTVAHELVHYRQDTRHELDDESGVTGSPEENQANELAGVVMRHFNKQHPEFLKSKPILAESRIHQQYNHRDFVNNVNLDSLLVKPTTEPSSARIIEYANRAIAIKERDIARRERKLARGNDQQR